MQHAAPALPSLDGMLQRCAESLHLLTPPLGLLLASTLEHRRQVVRQLGLQVPTLPLILQHCVAARCWCSFLFHMPDMAGRQPGAGKASAYNQLFTRVRERVLPTLHFHNVRHYGN